MPESIQKDEPDVIRTRNLLIWSQTRYRCATGPHDGHWVQQQNAYNTRDSQAVTHPSTNRARRCLTPKFTFYAMLRIGPFLWQSQLPRLRRIARICFPAAITEPKVPDAAGGEK